MSIDLDWSTLDQTLAQSLIGLVNRQLANSARPSFIGAVEVVSLDFGTTPPDIEIVDVRDVFRDFTDYDEHSEDEPDDKEPATNTDRYSSDEEFEWVSRRTAMGATDPNGLNYHHLPPHLRYGRGPSAEFFNGISAGMTQANRWQNGMISLPNLRDLRLSPHPQRPASRNGSIQLQDGPPQKNSYPLPSAPDTGQPDVQIHFRVEHQADLRLTLTTSMLINYPSPMFMSLPIKLSVIGVMFTGEVVLAYEGSKRRCHLSILDDLDPYGPVGGRPPKTPLPLSSNSSEVSLSSRPSKPLPIGLRLLPSIVIESEIGQADKHVLKNVTRVERFIQDIIRKTVEEELVFPNFHTILLPEIP